MFDEHLTIRVEAGGCAVDLAVAGWTDIVPPEEVAKFVVWLPSLPDVCRKVVPVCVASVVVLSLPRGPP